MLIKREVKPIMIPLRVKMEAGLKERLFQYAGYLDSSVDHVITQAVSYVLEHDKEFRAAESGVVSLRKVARAKKQAAAS